MKATKFFATAVIVLVAAFGVKAQVATPAAAKPVNLTFKSGDELVYHVSNMGNEYDFKVVIVTWRPALNFMWYMDGDVNQKGSIEIPYSQVADGKGLFNYFEPDAKKLDNHTSVWTSLQTFKALKGGGKAEVFFDDNKTTETLTKKATGTISVDINGEQKELSYLQTDNGKSFFDKKEIWVLDNNENPLIVYQNFGWTIKLKSIKQQ